MGDVGRDPQSQPRAISSSGSSFLLLFILPSALFLSFFLSSFRSSYLLFLYMCNIHDIATSRFSLPFCRRRCCCFSILSLLVLYIIQYLYWYSSSSSANAFSSGAAFFTGYNGLHNAGPLLIYTRYHISMDAMPFESSSSSTSSSFPGSYYSSFSPYYLVLFLHYRSSYTFL